MFGLLTTNIIIKNELKLLKEVTSTVNIHFKNYFSGIYANPYNYEYRQEIKKLEDIDYSIFSSYSIEYRIRENNFFIFANKEYIIIEHSKYSKVSIEHNLKKILNFYLKKSEATIIGFEISLIIDEVPQKINTLLNDKSLYPIYFYNKNSCKDKKDIIFIRYKLNNSINLMETQIEEFIYELCGNVKIKEADV